MSVCQLHVQYISRLSIYSVWVYILDVKCYLGRVLNLKINEQISMFQIIEV